MNEQQVRSVSRNAERGAPSKTTGAAQPDAGHQPQGIFQLLNLPNFLTLGRIICIPLFLSLLSRQRYHAALYVFVGAALTDGLDGALARWRNCRTEVGAFLDPFADKLLLVSAFVALTVLGMIPPWLLSVIVIRDVVIVFGYAMVAFFIGERIPVRPSYAGKICTVLQLSCVLIALMNWPHLPNWRHPWHWLLDLTVIMTAISGLQYTYRGLILLKNREPQMFA